MIGGEEVKLLAFGIPILIDLAPLMSFKDNKKAWTNITCTNKVCRYFDSASNGI
jgi:hypothetical protein